MNIPVTVSFSRDSMQRFAQAVTFNESERNQILRAMGARLIFLAQQNLGFRGTDRPEPWKLLSGAVGESNPFTGLIELGKGVKGRKGYAQRVGRPYATLYLNGDLSRGFRLGNPDGNSITVRNIIEYSSYHQDGTNKMPRRAFFPVHKDGSLTARAEAQLITAAKAEIEKLYRSSRS